VYQLRNLTTLSACALATASLLTACGGGSADTPALTAQATLYRLRLTRPRWPLRQLRHSDPPVAAARAQ